MLIKLVTSPAYAARAKECWATLVSSIELPIECSAFDVEEQDFRPLERRAWAHASWSERCLEAETPETGRIFLFSEFFGEHNDKQRSLVLLHEAVHLRLFRGALRLNYETFPKVLADVPVPNMELGKSTITDRRIRLAAALGSCVQEIACDKFLCLKYPVLRFDYLAQRCWYYGASDAYLGFDVQDSATALEPYFTAYRLIRAEAGCALYNGHPQLGDLERVRTRQRLEDVASDLDLMLQLPLLKQEIGSVRVSSDERHESDYLGLCRLALSHWGLTHNLTHNLTH